MNQLQIDKVNEEAQLTTSRSGGPGGQHINKVETKVTLRWNLGRSEALSPSEKAMVRAACAGKLTKDDDLIISSGSHRSQLKNKALAFKKLEQLLTKALTKKKSRKPTQPSKASKQKRLTSKRKNSEKKELRKKLF